MEVTGLIFVMGRGITGYLRRPTELWVFLYFHEDFGCLCVEGREVVVLELFHWLCLIFVPFLNSFFFSKGVS
jgi:hypothetical protein